MLVLLGTLGVAQALFLPGYVVARALGMRGAARLATASLALSLLAGLTLAGVLVVAEAWRREAWLAILAVEIALAGWLTARVRPAPAEPAARLPLSGWIAAAAILALSLWYAGRVARAASGIFSGWDDVASWNRWAMSWARGELPQHTWNYPQALPVAWATTYAFLGTDLVQAFARGMMPLFGLAAMLALAGSGGAPDRLRSLAAAWFAGTFLARVNNVTAGLADLPVAAVSAVAMAEFLRPAPPPGEPPAGAPPRALVLGLLCAAAALLKQAGLYVALVLPALHAAREPRGRRARAALIGYGAAAMFVLPWHAWKQMEIASGRETSEVLHVLTGAHATQDPLARAAAGFGRLAEIAGGTWVLVALLALGLLGLRDRAVRPLVLGVALPFSALWAFGFSYDPRNLSIALVAWALSCGAGLASLPGIAAGPAFAPSRPPRLTALGALVPVAAGVAALAVVLPDSRLLEHSRRLQRGLGDPGISEALFQLRDAGALRGKVAAGPDLLLAYAPEWDTRFVLTPRGDRGARDSALARPEVEWAVLPEGESPGDSVWMLARETARATLWRKRPVRQ